MPSIDDLLNAGLTNLPEKPPDSASRPQKKRYSELVSAAVALAFAAELRRRGLKGARPTEPGDVDKSGAERRMAGGIGAKKVDVTWATEESGLLLGLSIKTINFRDRRKRKDKDGKVVVTDGNFQKNLTNRRGDLLIEAVTLHRRFPYAVLAGFLFLDKGAASDDTTRRRSTFENAHRQMQLFTGRDDPADRDEQYEFLYVLLLEASPEAARVEAFGVGDPDTPIPLASVFDSIVQAVARRNPDFYECRQGNLRLVKA